MTLALLAGLAAALLAFLAGLMNWLQRRQSHEEGIVAQAGKEAAVSAIKQAAITEAAVDAPDTKDEVVERLRKRAF